MGRFSDIYAVGQIKVLVTLYYYPDKFGQKNLEQRLIGFMCTNGNFVTTHFYSVTAAILTIN